MSENEVVLHTQIGQFTKSVQGFLEQSEAENSLLLGILESFKSHPPKHTPFMLEVCSAGNVEKVAFYNERNLIISRGVSAEDYDSIASSLKKAVITIPGVIGPADDAEKMAQAWSRLGNVEYFLAMDQGLYQLTQVEQPVGIPGKARLFASGDLDLLAQWTLGFYRDAIPWETPALDMIQKGAKARILNGMTYLWEVDGQPVAMAALARPTRRTITVNLVFTPAEHRRQGYATALVAAISAEGLKRGKDACVLYTDLMNPTSNSIYQKVGYQRIGHSKNFCFRIRSS